MAGRSHGFGGVREDNRKLLAKENENDAVGRELDRVPNGVAPDAGRRFDLAGSLDEAHGQACRDRREDAGTVEVLGHEIGSERDQKADRSEEHTSELQSLMRISYAVFCLKKKKKRQQPANNAVHTHHQTRTNQTTTCMLNA